MTNDISDVNQGSKSQRQVKFDNMFDILFNDAGKPKENLSKKLVFTSDKLDFLENGG